MLIFKRDGFSANKVSLAEQRINLLKPEIELPVILLKSVCAFWVH